MLLLSVFHVHTDAPGSDEGCSECMHHVRHAHINPSTGCIGQCVLCQFQTLTFIAATLTAVSIPQMVRRYCRTGVCLTLPVRQAGLIYLRAPPMLMTVI